ncbi:MAG: alcohol dehydrogenase [Phycisphaerales bacterium]|nr:alcohol dehydrogenase catalytic domain-containing protein [Phycisphaerales bacterium]GIK19539.1 MAG: alcohol dehydrogenase [Planctomycetota bacterium]
MRAVRSDGRLVSLDRAAREPSPAAGEALIRPLRIGIGAADMHAFRNPAAFTGILGHEAVGVVERVNPLPGREDHRKFEGARVVCSPTVVCGRCSLCRAGLSNHCRERTVMGLAGRDGCLADRFTLPVANLFAVPDSIDDEAAVFAEPLGSVLHAGLLAPIESKTYVTVLGDGPVALLAAQVMARRNASVRLLGRHPDHFGLCEKWGVKHRHMDEAGRRQDQDIVLDCTGTAAGLDLALQFVRPRGTVILKAPPTGTGPAPGLDPARIIDAELQLLGSRGSRIADALLELEAGRVDVVSLITRRFRLDDALNAFAAAQEPGQVKVLVEV